MGFDGEDRGVSSVVGTILLVGLVVILISLFAANTLGTLVQQDPPNAEFDVKHMDGDVIVTFWNGDPISPDELEVRINGEMAGYSQFNDLSKDMVVPGDSIRIDGSGLTGLVEVRVDWKSSQTGTSSLLTKQYVYISPGDSGGTPILDTATAEVENYNNQHGVQDVLVTWELSESYDLEIQLIDPQDGTILGSESLDNPQLNDSIIVDITNGEDPRNDAHPLEIIVVIEAVGSGEDCEGTLTDEDETIDLCD